MTEPILLEVSGLSKSFDQVKAVSGVSFQIGKGQVVGLIGANGAGKTTTMRMLPRPAGSQRPADRRGGV